MWDQSLPSEKSLWKMVAYSLPIVESRESADLSNIVDPSFYKDNENTDPENKHTYQR